MSDLLLKMASINDPYGLFEPYVWKDKIGDSLWHCEIRSVGGIMASGIGKTMDEAVEMCDGQFKENMRCDEDVTTKDFLDDIVGVCVAHGFSLSHEDTQGAFVVEEYKEENIDWLKAALKKK